MTEISRERVAELVTRGYVVRHENGSMFAYHTGLDGEPRMVSPHPRKDRLVAWDDADDDSRTRL